MKIIDLSLPIDETAFEVHKVDIERVTHKAGVEKFNRVIMGKTLLGRIKYEGCREGYAIRPGLR